MKTKISIDQGEPGGDKSAKVYWKGNKIMKIELSESVK